MESLTYRSETEDATRQLGIALGQRLKEGQVIGLNGTLGSGKTRLVKAIGIGLGIDEETVVSPTFTICVPYEGRLKVLHLDAYRINHFEEVDELGLDEEIESGAVLIVEWVDEIKEALPPMDLLIHATPMGETTREFEIRGESLIGSELVASLKSQFS